MFRVTTSRITEEFERVGPTGRRVVTVIREQPSWVGRLALVAAGLAVLVIAFLLVVPALVLGIFVFLVGAGLHLLLTPIRMLRGSGSRRTWEEGQRQNVRVLGPERHG